MRTLPALVLALLAAPVFAAPCLAGEVPLLDGHAMHGRIEHVTAKGLELHGTTKSGGSYVFKLSADHIDPHWWYARRDAALGDDAKARLQLAVWAVEHGLFRQGKAQFEKARVLDPAAAKEFQEHIIPGLRAGIADDLVGSAHRTMNAGKLTAANTMLHAVLTRFGDTHAAGEARTLLPTLQHRMDAKLKELAHWKKFSKDIDADRRSAERRKVTDPIVALIRQGHNILTHMPPMAAQAAGATHTRQAAIEYQKALAKIDAELNVHQDDKELVARLEALREQAQAGLVQCHVTAGDIYATTGNYNAANEQADTLATLDPASAQALRDRVGQSQSWDQDGIVANTRWVGRRRGGRRR